MGQPWDCSKVGWLDRCAHLHPRRKSGHLLQRLLAHRCSQIGNEQCASVSRLKIPHFLPARRIADRTFAIISFGPSNLCR